MTPHRSSHRALGTATALLLSTLALGCSGSKDAPLPQSPLRRDIAASLGENVILPTYRDLAAAVAALEATVTKYAASLDPVDLAAAQQAWRDAMLVVERAELMQVGPAGKGGATVEAVAGGQYLRLDIYAWPVVSACRIDEETTGEVFRTTEGLKAALVNVRTLAAVEYLLFAPSTANSCTATSAINADGTWAALEAEIPARRAAYAVTAVKLVRAATDALLAAWEPASGNFLGELQNAGQGSKVYTSAQEALNGVSDAMFYLYTDTKDAKIAVPAGISALCLEAAGICPDARESRYSEMSKASLLVNLDAFEDLFFGGDVGGTELGLDDLLVALGAGDIATTMSKEIAEARAAIEAIPEPLGDAVTGSLPLVVAAHDALGDVTLLFKTQIASLLDLEEPARAAGDND